MSEKLQPMRLTAVHVAPDTAVETVLGELEFGAGGTLAVRTALPEYRNFLEKLVRETNAHEVVYVKVPGKEMFASEAEGHQRTDPDFLQGLCEFVQQSYLVNLVAEEGPGLARRRPNA